MNQQSDRAKHKTVDSRRKVFRLERTDLVVPKSIYTADVLIKAAYMFLHQAYLHITEDETAWTIHFSAKEGGALDGIAQRFENDLLAQQVRRLVFQQTHSLREILMARAMSSSLVDQEDTLARLEKEQGQQAHAAGQFDSIMKDWFERNEK